MRPRVLLFTCERWPTAAMLADAMIASGLEVGALRPSGHPLAALAAARFQRVYHHGSRHGELIEAIGAFQPTLVIPCDDTAVAVLHEHYARFAGQREAAERLALLQRSLGDPSHFETARKKSLFIALARDNGLLTPATHPVRDIADLRAAADGPWPQVLKADGGYGGHGVRVVHNLTQAIAAYIQLAGLRRHRTMLKDALREGSMRPFHRAELVGRAAITLQQFIPGVSVNRAVVCDGGRVIAGRTFEAIETMPGNGHATVVRTRHIPVVDRAAEQAAAMLGLSGLAGFDFIYDEASGKAYLLEMNPRATSGCYAAPKATPPLARTLADFLIHADGPDKAPFSAEPVIVPEALIVLFPHEIERDPRSAYLDTADHVAPTHDLKLVDACLRHARRTPPVIRLSNRLKRFRTAAAK